MDLKFGQLHHLLYDLPILVAEFLILTLLLRISVRNSTFNKIYVISAISVWLYHFIGTCGSTTHYFFWLPDSRIFDSLYFAFPRKALTYFFLGVTYHQVVQSSLLIQLSLNRVTAVYFPLYYEKVGSLRFHPPDPMLF